MGKLHKLTSYLMKNRTILATLIAGSRADKKSNIENLPKSCRSTKNVFGHNFYVEVKPM